MPRLSFSYWSDPLCIWAFVAQGKLERLLLERGELLEVDYRVVPIFGSVPWRFAKGPWSRGGVAARVRATAEIAAKHGHDSVDGSCWTGDCPASSWAPGTAIKAVCALEKLGELEARTGGRYQSALQRAFFEGRKNTARRSVQLEVAESLDIPHAPIERCLDDGTALSLLWEDHLEKERLRLQGSPSYVFDDGRALLYGNVTYGVLHATVEELLRGMHPEGSFC